MAKKEELRTTWLILKITFGVLPIVAGLDKLFFNIIAEWATYLSPVIENILPLSAPAFMILFGVIEIVSGILVLSKYTKIGAYIVSGWLLLITVNLLILGAFDIAIRDFVMAISAFCLGRLTEEV